MPVLHALHRVLIALFIVANILLIPVSAGLGIVVADITAAHIPATLYEMNEIERNLALGFGGFMAIGLINGILTCLIVIALGANRSWRSGADSAYASGFGTDSSNGRPAKK